MSIFGKSAEVFDYSKSNEEFDTLLILNIALYKEMCNKRDNINTVTKLSNCIDGFDENLDIIQKIKSSE